MIDLLKSFFETKIIQTDNSNNLFEKELEYHMTSSDKNIKELEKEIYNAQRGFF